MLLGDPVRVMTVLRLNTSMDNVCSLMKPQGGICYYRPLCRCLAGQMILRAHHNQTSLYILHTKDGTAVHCLLEGKVQKGSSMAPQSLLPITNYQMALSKQGAGGGSATHKEPT